MPDSTTSSASVSPIVPPRQVSSSSSYASQKDSRLAPLATLEYLQNQRRGSITDPSLHAVTNSSGLKPPSSFRSAPSPMLNEPSPKSRPKSPYPPESSTSPHLRNLLRSPSLEPLSLRHHPDSISKYSSSQGVSSRDHKFLHLANDTDSNGSSHLSVRDSPSFDYNMRRHSIATGQQTHPQPILPPVAHGIKRKMSSDRSVFAPVGEETDSQLVGPGVPSVMEVDTEGPAPKRRGSAIDTQRLAQLNINDRRGSSDSRSSAPWWNNDRRDSTPSILSTASSSGGYSSGFTATDSIHGRPPPPGLSSFSWPNQQPSDSPHPHTGQNGAEITMSGLPRQPFDTNTNPPPPFNNLASRRMSIPDTLVSAPGSTKGIRPRSRPPSRQGSGTESMSRSNSGQDNPNGSLGSVKKELNAAPYSRSPELRVSHKLAERKRRKEMKDLFDELRDQLPADRGMKASKWEILTKAIDYVIQLKQTSAELVHEVEHLRQELDIAHGGNGQVPPFQPSSQVLYGFTPIPISPPQGSSPQPPLLPTLPGPGQLPLPSRTQNMNLYPSLSPSPLNTPNGNFQRSDATPP